LSLPGNGNKITMSAFGKHGSDYVLIFIAISYTHKKQKTV